MSGFPESVGLQVAQTRLKLAQVSTLFSAPTVVVPAPGAGRAILVLYFSVVYTSAARTFTEFSVPPQLFYGAAAITAGRTASSAIAPGQLAPPGSISWANGQTNLAQSVAANQPVVIGEQAGDPAVTGSGTNLTVVTVYYVNQPVVTA